MHADRIYELIARRLSGEATPAEEQELNQYLQQHAGDQFLYDLLQKYWLNHPHPEAEEPAGDEEERFHRIMQGADGHVEPEHTLPDIEAPVRRLSKRTWLYYATAAASLLFITTLIYFYQHKTAAAASTQHIQLSEVSAQPGSRSKIILPDGTQVWLNAESRLTYESSFNNTLREVNLEGEAYFDVTHNASRPFIVHTSGIAIKVLGTAFTVKSYATDKTIEATLLRGSIEVVKNNDASAPKVILRPHEKLVFNKEEENRQEQSAGKQTADSATMHSGIVVTTLPKNKPDSVLKETAWVYNKLVFEGDHFDELAIKLERWYDVHIHFTQEQLKQYRFKGAFETETIAQALDALRLTAPFEYSIYGNDIEITPPTSKGN